MDLQPDFVRGGLSAAVVVHGALIPLLPKLLFERGLLGNRNRKCSRVSEWGESTERGGVSEHIKPFRLNSKLLGSDRSAVSPQPSSCRSEKGRKTQQIKAMKATQPAASEHAPPPSGGGGQRLEEPTERSSRSETMRQSSSDLLFCSVNLQESGPKPR